jgi:hypothetical protein
MVYARLKNFNLTGVLRVVRTRRLGTFTDSLKLTIQRTQLICITCNRLCIFIVLQVTRLVLLAAVPSYTLPSAVIIYVRKNFQQQPQLTAIFTTDFAGNQHPKAGTVTLSS